MTKVTNNGAKPLTIFYGLPGSGKSKQLIERVNAAKAQGRAVLTFACSDSPWLTSRAPMRVQKLLGCRQPGLTCHLDHFVSAAEAAATLERVAPGTLVAIEEAHYFPVESANDWIKAAQRGVEVIVCMPSTKQHRLLREQVHEDIEFKVICERCKQADATKFIALPDEDATRSLCAPCEKATVEEVRKDIAARLQSAAPYPGEQTIYQPVDIPECKGWNVLRPDSARRVEIMTSILGELGVLLDARVGNASYLDVGCNTGYFCHRMHRLGFQAEGEDVVKEDIAVAKIIDAYIRHDRNVFVAKDAYAYLEDSQDRMFDVTSAFAVFQWLMIQKNAQRGITCFEWLFAKTRRVCFVEMGYSAEAQYKDRLPINIDRAWMENLMREKGGFAEIRVFPAGEEHGISRDLFVGIKPTYLWDLTQAVKKTVPTDATVAVVSKGDEWLLKLGGQPTVHFPQDKHGAYSGHHPTDDAEAIAMLEAAQKRGAQYLAFPGAALWWLDYYVGFRAHLENKHQLVWNDSRTAIYRLGKHL